MTDRKIVGPSLFYSERPFLGFVAGGGLEDWFPEPVEDVDGLETEAYGENKDRKFCRILSNRCPDLDDETSV